MQRNTTIDFYEHIFYNSNTTIYTTKHLNIFAFLYQYMYIHICILCTHYTKHNIVLTLVEQLHIMVLLRDGNGIGA